MKHILSYGTELEDVILEELAETAKHYQALLERLKTLPEGNERDDLEGELYSYIVELKIKSSHLQAHLDELVDTMLDEEKVQPTA